MINAINALKTQNASLNVQKIKVLRAVLAIHELEKLCRARLPKKMKSKNKRPTKKKIAKIMKKSKNTKNRTFSIKSKNRVG